MAELQLEGSGIGEFDTVWRYTNLAELMTIVHDRTLWLAPLTSMQDKREGAWYVQTGDYKEDQDRFRRHARVQSGISCWSVADSELLYMWNQYAPGNNGVAIESSIRRLQMCTLQGMGKVGDRVEHMSIRPVVYTDAPADIAFRAPGPSDPRKALSYKSSEFRHEKEIRFVYYKSVLHPDKSPFSGRAQPINPEALISSVRVSPTAPWLVPSVKTMLDSAGLHRAEVYESKLTEHYAGRPGERTNEWHDAHVPLFPAP